MSENAAAAVTATNLLLLGGSVVTDTFNLASLNNNITTIAGHVLGSIQFANGANDALTVGTVATYNGIATGGGSVT